MDLAGGRGSFGADVKLWMFSTMGIKEASVLLMQKI